MTALQMAKLECANWQIEGCTGMSIGDDLKMALMPVAGKPCLLSQEKPCQYFQECVLPMAMMVNDPKTAQQYSDVAYAYRLKYATEKPSDRTCADCSNAVGPRKTYCPVCARKRQKARCKANYDSRG